jgi:2-amino-4-hydroxy-6-hydroxymethyldihydropteridine diphosphokinase
MKEIFILLGSNRGDRKSFLARALEMVEIQTGSVCRKSSLYETEPWGFDDPTPFLNQVVEVETDLDPLKLLDQLLTIEVKLGRIRPFDGCGCGVPQFNESGTSSGIAAAPVYTGRTIDLDILFYGDRLVFTETLMIPHPRLHERRFSLVPLNEVAPGFIHPLLKKPVSVLLNDCRDQAKVNLFHF